MLFKKADSRKKRTSKRPVLESLVGVRASGALQLTPMQIVTSREGKATLIKIRQLRRVAGDVGGDAVLFKPTRITVLKRTKAK